VVQAYQILAETVVLALRLQFLDHQLHMLVVVVGAEQQRQVQAVRVAVERVQTLLVGRLPLELQTQAAAAVAQEMPQITQVFKAVQAAAA
jgi:hypothetical protein